MNGILIIDKEKGWTAQDVVSKLRGITSEKRIGHTGTLDPMATGVLPIVIGKATRLSNFLMADDKEYLCEITFGMSTDTEDIWGNVIATSPKRPTEAAFLVALRSLIGPQLQTPPMFSAIKIRGKRLYELARDGKIVERKQRKVYFHTLELIEFVGDCATFRAEVSKGTYMRTLCKDLGEMLGSYAVMSGLKRTRSGSFFIDDALTVRHFENMTLEERFRKVMPMDHALRMPCVKLNVAMERKVLNGQRIPTEMESHDWVKVYGEEGFIGIGTITDGVLHVKKVLSR